WPGPSWALFCASAAWLGTPAWNRRNAASVDSQTRAAILRRRRTTKKAYPAITRTASSRRNPDWQPTAFDLALRAWCRLGTVEELLTIGEFSRACGLSARVLRSYAGIGLLPPVAVDRWTGYRYYAPSQVQRAVVIGLLRQAGMPLRDIAGFLPEPDPGRLDEWEHRLGRELASRHRALAAARRELSTLPPVAPPAAQGLAGQPPAGLIAGSASVQGPARTANQDAVLADGDL